MASRSRKAPAPVVAPPAAAIFPAWPRWAILALSALLLVVFFSTEVSDTDTWWHLKTGQYIVQRHALPVPDPFAYTTYMGKPSYAGEETTRRFNLTHEWLAQAYLYGVYAAAGFPGLVLLRALCLAAFCGLAGWLVYGRTRGFYRALGASFAASLVVRGFVSDRPQYLTYVFLGVTLAILESRRRLWLLPPLFLLWANCHGGFILGWAVVAAYCAESLFLRWRGRPLAGERQMWLCGAAAVVACGLNPNFLRVFEVLRHYRESAMQSRILEWQYPKLGEVSQYTVLLFGAIAVLLWNWRKVRAVDWLLLAIFGAASVTAFRNIIFLAFIGAFLIAVYLPARTAKPGAGGWLLLALLAAAEAMAAANMLPVMVLPVLFGIGYLLWMGRFPWLADGAIAVLLVAGSGVLIAQGRGLQLRAAAWKVPAATADFLLAHHIQGRIFNTYEQGGYLLWRLWPQQQVFQDGRALNESVFLDGTRIAMNADAPDGRTTRQILRQYGIDVIAMSGFEPYTGTAYYLPAALADPAQTEWKLVYRDAHDVVFMRRPPPGLRPLNSWEALAAMEDQCMLYVEHGSAECSQGMVDIFTRAGDQGRARKWSAIFRGAKIQSMLEPVR